MQERCRIDIQPITTEADYKAALKEIEALWNATIRMDQIFLDGRNLLLSPGECPLFFCRQPGRCCCCDNSPGHNNTFPAFNVNLQLTCYETGSFNISWTVHSFEKSD